MNAELARNAGDFDEAARTLDEAIAKFPDLEEAYALSCRIYHPGNGPLQNPRKLLAVTEAGVAAVPSSTLILNFHGYALLESDRYADAIRVFESYAQLAPREPNPFDSLGETHIKMGQPEKALEYFSKALTIHPTFFPSQFGRAWALGMIGRYDEAIAAAPPQFSFLRGFLLSRVGRYREADDLLAMEIGRARANSNLVDQGLLRALSAVIALERGQPALVAEKIRAPDGAVNLVAPDRQRVYTVLAHTIAGLAALQTGQVDDARVHLDAQRRIVSRDVPPELWWHKLLEGEIALAGNDLQRAATAFTAGEPAQKMWVHLNSGPLTILANNLPARDGVARVARGRGDLAGAIAHYRHLLTAGPNQKWTAMYEPRYVLEIARLLDRSGDKSGALKEYARFLDLWSRADTDLPELAEARRAMARLKVSEG